MTSLRSPTLTYIFVSLFQAMQTFQKPLAEVKNDFMDQALKYLETEWMGPKTEDDTVPDEHLATLKVCKKIVSSLFFHSIVNLRANRR